MDSNVVVKLENVSKYYKLYDTPKDRLKEALNPFRKKYHKEFYALQNINFELKRGECLGIIGRNGMGKSTLLKLIAHIIEPSSGNVFVNGTVSALLELGTGFNPEFTGLQNIYFYGTILGFDKKQIEQKKDEIISFADIGEFITQPVKTYSSGMFVRLAFSVQTSLTPDVLLVDEVLSVGDVFFQQKCHARIEDLLAKGTALILVSHDMQLIEKYSKKTMYLNLGNVEFLGEPATAIQKFFSSSEIGFAKSIKPNSYINKSLKKEENNITMEGISLKWPKDSIINADNIEVIGRSEIARFSGIAITNDNNISQAVFNVDENINIYYEFILLKDIEIPVGGIEIRNSKNIFIHGRNTLQYDNHIKLNDDIIGAGSILRFLQRFKLSIAPDDYIISLGMATINNAEYKKNFYEMKNNFKTSLDVILRVPRALSFSVKENNNLRNRFFGLTDIEGEHIIHVSKTGLSYE